ncbi:MAG: hypothetical protein HUU28_12885 [Planctomycetaceae bacterium]|nr:hypothetical protein [Planctomycetaceae bacterium]
MKEQRKDEASREEAKDEAEKAAPKAPADPRKPAGMNYVFKIAPADPKNSFDFEDVADK